MSFHSAYIVNNASFLSKGGRKAKKRDGKKGDGEGRGEEGRKGSGGKEMGEKEGEGKRGRRKEENSLCPRGIPSASYYSTSELSLIPGSCQIMSIPIAALGTNCQRVPRDPTYQ